jgi:hypothetical protein
MILKRKVLKTKTALAGSSHPMQKAKNKRALLSLNLHWNRWRGVQHVISVQNQICQMSKGHKRSEK